MNLSKMIVISLFVLMLSSYETDSSFLFGFLMKLLMIKSALFMAAPLSLGAFVMGQGMGFFAGNMMGGYMMLRAANRYHNKEKSRWTAFSGWHGPPFNTNTYQKGYQKGKAIVDAVNAGRHKINAIASIFKPFIPTTTKRPIGWSTSPKYAPPPPPPPSYGPPEGWSTGVDYSYGSYSDPNPTTVHPAYPPPPPPPSLAYGHPPPIGGPLDYQDYYPGGNRKTGFSSVLTNTLSGGNRLDEEGGSEPEKIRRVFTDAPSPSGFYTSAYRSPGAEFTGMLTNDPTSQGGKYLRGEPDTTESSRESSSTMSSVTSQPNDILEGYLEQRLKAEAEKQKDMERKQEAQQLLQMLRKAYLKQLVDSLKEEEVAQKTKSNRRLESSPFSSLTSSIESLFGSRESRSMERKNDNEVGSSASSSASGSLSSNTQELIRDLLINEVFTSSTSPRSVEVEKPEDHSLDTQEVASITERIMGLTSTEREELVKGLDEIGQDQEEDEMSALGSSIVEQVIAKPMLTLTDADYADSLLKMIASTENSIGSSEGNEEPKRKREDRGFPVIPPAMWVPVDDAFSAEMNMNINTPFAVRVRRQTGKEEGMGSLAQAQQAAAGGGVQSSAENNPEAQKQVQAFVDDIRKFFTLLSALDQDQCLQKLVCDVHTNEKDISTLTQYEQNILTTFKLMKALMPEGEEDSSTKYRYAAMVGETSQSMELCQQTFSSCKVDSSQIVELGSQPQDASGMPVDLSKLQSVRPGPVTDASPPPPPTSTTTRPKARPAPVPDQDSKETETQRRNDYEGQSEYYDPPPPQRRRRPQTQQQQQYQNQPQSYQHPQQFHREQIQYSQYSPSNSNRRQQPPQREREPQPHYKIRERYPQRDRHDIEEQPNPRDPPPRESRPPPPPLRRPQPSAPQDSKIWDYGEFSDFFRNMWSDTMMRGRMGRSHRHHPSWRNQNRNSARFRWGSPVERIEEIGI